MCCFHRVTFFLSSLFFQQSTKQGELTTVLTANTALVRNGATTQLALALKGFVQFVSILTYLCVTNGALTGFFMGIALIPLAVAGLALTCVSKITKNMTDSQGDQGAIAEEHVGGIRTVSSFSMQEKAKTKYDKAANVSNYWGVMLSWVQGSTFAFVIGGFYFALSFAQWRGGHMIEGTICFPPACFFFFSFYFAVAVVELTRFCFFVVSFRCFFVVLFALPIR
jgi:ABC-type multidrug transport system fused ATPase/permease subunit